MANLDSFLGGYSAGNQMAEQGRQQRNRAAIQSLAPRIIGGDPQAFSKAAALDPQAATGLQQSGEGMIRRARGAAQYLQKALQGGNPMEISAARRSIKPYMDTLRSDQQYPMDMDPAQEAAGIQSFLAETQMYDPSYSMQGGNGVQSTYVDADGNRIAIMRNGTTQVLGRNDAGSNQQTLSVDINGVPTQVTFDRRTGGYTNANIGGQQPQQQIPQQSDMEADIALANQMIAANIPAEQVDAFLAQRGQRAQQMAPQAGVPIVGRTKEAEAAAVEQARSGAQLANLPTELGMRTNAAIQQAAGIEQAKTQAERNAQAPKRIKQYEQALTAAGNVENSIDKALSLLGNTSTGWIGSKLRDVRGTSAFDLKSELETVKANLGFDRLQQMRDNSPTGGALGAIAVQELVALQSTIANLDPDQSESQIRANLERVKKHYENWKSAVQQSLRQERLGSQSGQQVAPQRARNPQTGEVIELRNGQWVPVR